jgi:hypothetical protein
VAVFSGPPLVCAAGRIASGSRYGGDGSGGLWVSDLRGRARVLASFRTPEAFEAFAFDGTRLAFAPSVYRPDQGTADDGLWTICVGDRILLQATASVIEVHRSRPTAAGRPHRCRSPRPHRSPAIHSRLLVPKGKDSDATPADRGGRYGRRARSPRPTVLPLDEPGSDGAQLDVHICSTDADTDRVLAPAWSSSKGAIGVSGSRALSYVIHEGAGRVKADVTGPGW